MSAAVSEMDHEPIGRTVSGALVPAEWDEAPGADDDEREVSQLPQLRVLAHGISRKKLEAAIRELGLPATTARTADDADAVVTIRNAFKQRGTPIEMLNAYYDGLKAQYLPRPAEVNYEHAARQAYIAFGVALTAAAFEEVDATPMEGFDPAQVDEILGLNQRGLRSVVLLPLGYRDPSADWLLGMKKVRKSNDTLVTLVD